MYEIYQVQTDFALEVWFTIYTLYNKTRTTPTHTQSIGATITKNESTTTEPPP